MLSDYVYKIATNFYKHELCEFMHIRTNAIWNLANEKQDNNWIWVLVLDLVHEGKNMTICLTNQGVVENKTKSQ